MSDLVFQLVSLFTDMQSLCSWDGKNCCFVFYLEYKGCLGHTDWSGILVSSPLGSSYAFWEFLLSVVNCTVIVLRGWCCGVPYGASSSSWQCSEQCDKVLHIPACFILWGCESAVCQTHPCCMYCSPASAIVAVCVTRWAVTMCQALCSRSSCFTLVVAAPKCKNDAPLYLNVPKLSLVKRWDFSTDNRRKDSSI